DAPAGGTRRCGGHGGWGDPRSRPGSRPGAPGQPIRCRRGLHRRRPRRPPRGPPSHPGHAARVFQRQCARGLENAGVSGTAHKIPVSTLVVIHDPDLNVLLLERADRPGFWQSVTGSQDPGETLEQTAVREVMEETGLDARAHRLVDWNLSNIYEIYPIWRHRYAPGTTHNTE